MHPLLAFLNSLSPASQVEFATKVGTSVGYLRSAVSAKKRLGLELAVACERESGGQVTREQIRPDIDWLMFERGDRGARVRA